MPQRLAIYPGSFDPVTNGHVDILERARGLFDEVVVAVAENIGKSALFSAEERVALLEGAFDGATGVEVCAFSGLLIDYARKRGAHAIVRGLRAVADFEYEFQLALMNRRLAGEIDTVFLMTAQKNLYISSSLVKEVARFGGEISSFVPANVEQALRDKMKDA